MNTQNLFLAPECLGSHMELVDVTPDYYGSLKERQPEPVGFKYAILLREHGCERLVVKIDGPQLIESPVNGFGPMVEFEALRVRPYVAFDSARPRLALTATASSVHTVPAPGGGPKEGK